MQHTVERTTPLGVGQEGSALGAGEEGSAPGAGEEGSAPGAGEEGSALVDFVAVGALLTLLFVGVVQLTVVLHVRNTLTDCASEGARYGAFADRTPADGAGRTEELIGLSLSPRYADDVTARVTTTAEGVEVVEVTVRAPLPVIGLLGTARGVTVSGHGAVEGR